MATSPSTGSSFTSDGRYFALLSVDNRLRIWDMFSGKLLREFSSASHVESTCTCLCWTPPKKDGKKITGSELSSILIGHSNGKTILYNPSSDQCDKIYIDAGSQKVNCIASDSGSEKFYSCVGKFIAQWSIEGKNFMWRWKADKMSVNMAVVGPSGKTLLSAGMSIKLWNLETKQEIMQFNGHSSPVSLLQFSGFRTISKDTDDEDGCYFLSGATEDRLISAWHINYAKPEKSTIATFMTSERPVFLQRVTDVDGKQPVNIAVGCKDGRVFYYLCSMNGKISRPIQEEKTLSVKQVKGPKKFTPATLINGILSMENGSIILKFAAGSSLRPSFRDHNFSSSIKNDRVDIDSSENIFMKEHSLKSSQTVELAQIRGTQHVIGSTYAIPKLDVNDNVKDRQKTEDKSMVERLKEAGLYSQSSRLIPTSSNSASSFSVLLIQAIHTNDVNMIFDILSRKVSAKIIHNTIQRMPPGVVVELLNQIIDKMQCDSQPTASTNLTVWIRTILTVHLASLSLLPNITESMGKLFSLLKAQQEMFPYLFNLQGKMELLISQVTKDSISGEQDKEDEESLTNPCLIFHDDSEDDDDDEFLERIRRDSVNNEESENEEDDENSDKELSSSSDEEATDDDDEDDEEIKADDVDSDDDSGTF